MILALRKSATSLLRFLRRHRAGLMISAVCAVLSLGLYDQLYLISRHNPVLQFLRSMELKTLDMRFELRGPRQAVSPIVIVKIDQKSEDVLGRWPFPRSDLARALDFLRQAGARVVVFDINFPEPDQDSVLQRLSEVKTEYGELGKNGTSAAFQTYLGGLIKQANNDQQFVKALSQFPEAILGYFFLPHSEATAQDLQRVQDFNNYLSFQTYPQVSYYPSNPRWSGAEIMKRCISLFQSSGGPEYSDLSPNLPAFANDAKNFGYFNVFSDPDGTVRREPVVALYEGNFYPSLDVAAAIAFLNVPLDKVSAVFNPNGLQNIDLGGKLTIPTDPAGYVQIDYQGPAGTYPEYSIADVVQHKISPDFFRGKLVLVGPTATGIGDMAVTPFQQMGFPGVEVHANFIDDILSNHFIRRGNGELATDVLFLLLFSLGAGLLLNVTSPVRATSVLLVILGLFLWLAYDLFAAHRIWILVFLPVATLTTNYAGIISYRFFFEEREKKRVRGAFQQYLPPGLINQLLARPELLRLGGEEKELSIMFSDIRGFTALSEGLTPSQLVDLLNEYLSEMTDVIFKHWGTLDKYIGDAIMAFWGSPYPQADHAERACAAALHMLRSLETLRQAWAAQSRPLIDIGVGINTGQVLVGNMGSNRRFNFTIMGDNVNLASRLEGLNKQFATRLIISEYTYQKVQDKFVARELDLIRVKGKKVPVKIYELLGPAEEADSHHQLISQFHCALTDYRDGQWQAAIEILENLLRDYPQDGPCKVLLGRCQDFLAHPPEGEWDGVYVMKTK